MPFLLLITLLWFKRFAQRKALEPSDAAFGLAAAMVAILPLRQVLVPSTIPGLTRLDLLFGLLPRFYTFQPAAEAPGKGLRDWCGRTLSRAQSSHFKGTLT